MNNIEDSLLLDICLGFSLGEAWAPRELPRVETGEIPTTYLLNGEQLAQARRLADSNDPFMLKAAQGLSAGAEQYLRMPNPSVTRKKEVPPGATKNDYVSLAKYWWPNPDTPDGQPYHRLDGKINPECYSENSDLARLEHFADGVVSLALAAYMTRQPKFAEKAAAMIRAWMLDSETAQTPHFRFAQLAKGVEKIRYQGIIEARRLIYVCEAVRILEHLGALEPAMIESVRVWFIQLLAWLDTSEQGVAARAAVNNIGFWTDLQMLVYAKFCGEEEIVKRVALESVIPKIRVHIHDDGTLPEELKRAKPYDYVAFTLLAMAGLDTVSRHGDIKLGEYSTEEGRSFQNAFEWFYDTLKLNELQDSGSALIQLALARDEIARLKAGQSGVVDKEDASRSESSVNEEERLRSELNGQRTAIVNMALRVRGMEFFLKIRQKTIEAERERARNDARQIAALQRSLDESTVQNRNLTEALSREQAQVETVRAEKETLEKERRSAEKRCKDLENSTSWKLTYPLRIASKIARALLRKWRVGRVIGKSTPDKSIVRAAKKEGLASSASKYFMGALKRVKPVNIDKLKQEYAAGGLDKEPDTFVLYRIIGNDLYPRHKKGQSRENLQFVLEHEPALDNCEKRWVVNRIIDGAEEQAIIKLLKEHGQEYLHIPFDPAEYKKIGLDINKLPRADFLYSREYEDYKEQDKQRVIASVYRLKNNYVMNNNGARNAALRDGRSRAKWVMPWDGNCFVTSAAWREIRAEITSKPYLKYFTVPMARVTNNDELLSDGFQPDPVEEPQVVFRKDTSEEFNEEFYYGRRPKVELFWRLGIPGQWDRWRDDPWDTTRRPLSSEAGQFGQAGWVARMSSGAAELERDSQKRYKTRSKAIIDTLQDVDLILSDISNKSLINLNAEAFESEAMNYKKNDLLRTLIDKLMKDADEILYDRTRLQRVFDDSLILALAWKFSGQMKYAEHGALILERFFVNPETAMNPHLEYAQVRMGSNNNKGVSSGIIEFKDFYYYLDAVRLLSESGMIDPNMLQKFKAWLGRYLEWLLTSSQGKKEHKAKNNHGTYYDLQVAAIAAFLGDNQLLFETLIRAKTRIGQQFASDGSQPEELSRTITAHYCCYNFQGWLNLAVLAGRAGDDFWKYKSKNGAGLKKGAEWLLDHAGKKWPYKQIDQFDTDRFLPIWFGLPKGLIAKPASADFPESPYMAKPVFHPHDGIRPYWNVGSEKPIKDIYLSCCQPDKIKYLTYEKFIRMLGMNKYYSDNSKAKWSYFSVVIDVLQNQIQPRSILELGNMGISLSDQSHTMDEIISPYPNGVTYVMDATQLPWKEIGDKQYDVFVALQVFEHLDDRRVLQKYIFREIRRIAHHAVISIPYQWKEDVTSTKSFASAKRHDGIDDDIVIKNWAEGLAPSFTKTVGMKRKRKIYVWEYL